MPSFSYPSNKPREPPSSHALTGSDPFLSLSIDSNFDPWVPLSPDAERPDQPIGACQPWDDKEAEVPRMPFDIFIPQTRASRASSCTGQWQDQEAGYDPCPPSPLRHELPIHYISASELPLSDTELQAFFNSPQSPCHDDDSPSPGPQVQHSGDSDEDDDVVFLCKRKIQKDQPQRHRRKQGSRKGRSVKRIAKHTTRRTSTKWKNVALEEAGYHLDSGDEAFSWNRRQRSWKYRFGSYFTDLPEFDLFDTQFYITVRPNGGNGFPVKFSWNKEKNLFTGFDEMNQKPRWMSEDLVWELMCNPDKSQLLNQ